MGERKNVQSLSDERFRNAFSELKSSGGLARLVNVHSDGQTPQHGNGLFLPWHRAYILDLERKLQSKDPGVSLPFWDWIGTPRLPDIYATPSTEETNSLYHNGRTLGLENPDFPSNCCLDAAMQEDTFEGFGGDYSSFGNQDSPGKLENLHGLIHTWVGGDMEALAASPGDPIFWAHHANVDRLWAAWQASPQGKDPDTTDIPLPGYPDLTVEKVLDIKTLGYNYASVAPLAPCPEPDERRLPRGRRLKNRTIAGLIPVFEGPNLDLVDESISHPLPTTGIPPDISRADVAFVNLRIGPGNARTPAVLRLTLNGTDNSNCPESLFGTPLWNGLGHLSHRKLTLRVDVTRTLKVIMAGRSRLPVQIGVRFSPPGRPLRVDRVVLRYS